MLNSLNYDRAHREDWSHFFTIERNYDCDRFDNILHSFAWKNDLLNVMFYTDTVANPSPNPYVNLDSDDVLKKRREIVQLLGRASGFDIDEFVLLIHNKSFHHVYDFNEIINILDTVTNGSVTDEHCRQFNIIKENVIDYWNDSIPEAVNFRFKMMSLNM